jgi:hypothetical protein
VPRAVSPSIMLPSLQDSAFAARSRSFAARRNGESVGHVHRMSRVFAARNLNVLDQPLACLGIQWRASQRVAEQRDGLGSLGRRPEELDVVGRGACAEQHQEQQSHGHHRSNIRSDSRPKVVSELSE